MTNEKAQIICDYFQFLKGRMFNFSGSVITVISIEPRNDNPKELESFIPFIYWKNKDGRNDSTALDYIIEKCPIII